MTKHELLLLTNLPSYQNKMYCGREEARHCPRGDLRLVQDTATGLVHNAAYDTGLLGYDDSYQNEQGHSAAFREHIDTVLDKMQRNFHASTIMEVGCGKGAFLELLRQRGHEAIGIDPAYEGHDAHIIKAHFTPDLGVRADAIVMRHTLEHIADPLTFLESIYEANGGKGLIYIEVPCLDWILDHGAWFDLFYEHVNYFRLADFHRMFDGVIDSGRLFGEQYLYVFADLATLRRPGPADDTVVIPADLFDSLEHSVAKASSGKKKVLWGAAAKGVMFAHHTEQRGLNFDFAIDINPAKQFKYLAGTGLEVVSPDCALAQLRDGGDVFVMNSNYLSEIINYGGDHLNYIAVDQT